MSDAKLDMLAIVRSVGGDPLDLPFWEACREGKFLLHRCDICGRSYWPASRCIEHGARAMQWIEASGRGTIYTYTVMHHAYTPAMKGKTPYAVAVVKLQEGPFFHSSIVDCATDAIAIDMPVTMVMSQHESGLSMPVFRPEASQ
jgi:uncharacterized OB-fold protein